MTRGLPDIYRRVGARLKAERERQKITQEQLAERAQVGTSYLVKIEAGTRRAQLETLEDLAKVLRVPLAQLLPDRKPLPADGRTRASAAREGGAGYQRVRPSGASERELHDLVDLARDLD